MIQSTMPYAYENFNLKNKLKSTCFNVCKLFVIVKFVVICEEDTQLRRNKTGRMFDVYTQ